MSGRWINQDPIGEWSEKNLYIFVHNSPLHDVDILGLESFFITYGNHPVNDLQDIQVKKETGHNGNFNDIIEFAKCDFKISLTIVASEGTRFVPWFYVPHERGDDQASFALTPYGATLRHEQGHAFAYMRHVKPCAERIYSKWKGKLFDKTAQGKILAEYKACKTEAFWLDSAKYANEWLRNWFDVDNAGKYKRLAPGKVSIGGTIYEASDIWIELGGK